MRICFIGTTNKNYVMVNTLILKNNNDESKPVIVIDRDLTEYTIEDGIIKMEWRGCYVWDGENPNYNINDLDLNDYEADIELEDDAPEDYELKINNILFIKEQLHSVKIAKRIHRRFAII